MRSAACLHGDDSGVWRILAGDLFLRVEARGLAREIDEDVLPLCVVLENDFMCLAADAGLLVTAERRAFRNLVAPSCVSSFHGRPILTLLKRLTSSATNSS